MWTKMKESDVGVWGQCGSFINIVRSVIQRSSKRVREMRRELGRTVERGFLFYLFSKYYSPSLSMHLHDHIVPIFVNLWLNVVLWVVPWQQKILDYFILIFSSTVILWQNLWKLIWGKDIKKNVKDIYESNEHISLNEDRNLNIHKETSSQRHRSSMLWSFYKCKYFEDWACQLNWVQASPLHWFIWSVIVVIGNKKWTWTVFHHGLKLWIHF